jgi:hypothetical protein
MPGTTAIDRFLASVCDPSAPTEDVFSDDVTLDATVPDWRFTVRGADAVRAQFGRWYADPAAFESLERTPIPGGELVRFLLTWTEDGVPYAAHQAHVIAVDGDRIRADVLWCGGRWSASLLAEMEDAERVHA